MELLRDGHTQNVEVANTEQAVSIVFVCFEDTVSIGICRLNRTSNPCHPRANQGRTLHGGAAVHEEEVHAVLVRQLEGPF